MPGNFSYKKKQHKKQTHTKKKKNTKKTRERANHMSAQNKEHTGTVLYFFNLEMIHVV